MTADPGAGRRRGRQRKRDRHGAWNEQARGETKYQRLDRNFQELLQELRVLQTGVQILFAFLLTLAFTQRFTEITLLQRNIYIGALMLTLGSTGLLIGPVAYHRLTFRKRMRPQLVSLANVLTIAGMTLLMLALCTAVFFITDVVLTRGPAIALTASATAWLLTFWYIVPISHRLIHRHEPDEDEDEDTRGT